MPPSPPSRRTPGILLTLAVALANLTANAGNPWLPDSDDVVLVRLRLPTPATEPGPARGLAPRTAADPTDLAAALTQVRALTSAARREADPRHLAHAQQRLRPWWHQTNAPAALRLERARIRQGFHEFEAALADLDACLQEDPRCGEAWLLKASIHLVRGEYPEVKHASLQIARTSDALAALTLSATLRSLEDPLSGADRPLAAELRRRGDAPPALRAWAWTTLGGIQSRGSEHAAAEASFRTALTLEPGAIDPLASLADLLLDTRRPAEALALLRDCPHPSLRLRLAEALSQIDPTSPEARSRSAECEESFSLDTWRGETLHRREHARYLLRVRHDAAHALRLAQSNWLVQKEPADTRLLLEAASAAGQMTAIDSELAWIRRHQPGALR